MRQGVTLLEVLFAILIASVALLGAIAVFPVALGTAKRGQVADLTSVAGQSAIHAFDAEYMRRPARWLRWDTATSQPNFLPVAFNESGNALFGRAFCIDPRGFEYNRQRDIAEGQDNSNLWSWFPAVPETNPTPNAIPHSSRMVRLTLHNGNPAFPTTAVPMPFIQADKVFRIEDELIYERPDDNSLPAQQLFTGGSRRQEEGRLTWMATLWPKVDARQLAASTTNPATIDDKYVLSIVVFYNRTPDMEVPNNDDRPWNEWTAKVLAADFHSGGVGGGEVTITTNDPAQDPAFNAEEYVDVRRGSWLLLGRTIPTASTPIQYFQWYRVSDAGDTVPAGGRWQREVSLIGPDWPADLMPRTVLSAYDPTTGANAGDLRLGDGVAEECDVIIVPNVAHVYERTISLDR